MTSLTAVTFLLDVDNTLLDGDRLVADWKDHLRQAFDDDHLAQYWTIFEERRAELGYVDYLDALQGYRVNNPGDQHCPWISRFLLDYPFNDLVYPAVFDLIERLRGWGPTVVVSDGDVVYQPRKVERSGLRDAVEGRVLLYIHKEQELKDVEQRFPADHYVLVDDKPRALAAVKQVWGSRVATVFPRQGHYAHDVGSVAEYPVPDLTIERIGDLLAYDLAAFLRGASADSLSGTAIRGAL